MLYFEDAAFTNKKVWFTVPIKVSVLKHVNTIQGPIIEQRNKMNGYRV